MLLVMWIPDRINSVRQRNAELLLFSHAVSATQLKQTAAFPFTSPTDWMDICKLEKERHMRFEMQHCNMLSHAPFKAQL